MNSSMPSWPIIILSVLVLGIIVFWATRNSIKYNGGKS